MALGEAHATAWEVVEPIVEKAEEAAKAGDYGTALTLLRSAVLARNMVLDAAGIDGRRL